MLDVDNSVFVDFQKIRVQETQAELPKGCIPRSLEIILRSEAVESVQAGDRYLEENIVRMLWILRGLK